MTEGARGGQCRLQRGPEGAKEGQRGPKRAGEGHRGPEGDRGGGAEGQLRTAVPRIYPSPPGLRNALGLVGFRYFNYDFLTRQTKEITKNYTLTPHIYTIRNDDAFY